MTYQYKYTSVHIIDLKNDEQLINNEFLSEMVGVHNSVACHNSQRTSHVFAGIFLHLSEVYSSRKNTPCAVKLTYNVGEHYQTTRSVTTPWTDNVYEAKETVIRDYTFNTRYPSKEHKNIRGYTVISIEFCEGVNAIMENNGVNNFLLTASLLSPTTLSITVKADSPDTVRKYLGQAAYEKINNEAVV